MTLHGVETVTVKIKVRSLVSSFEWVKHTGEKPTQGIRNRDTVDPLSFECGLKKVVKASAATSQYLSVGDRAGTNCESISS
jgi:hypothetical protein